MNTEITSVSLASHLAPGIPSPSSEFWAYRQGTTPIRRLCGPWGSELQFPHLSASVLHTEPLSASHPSSIFLFLPTGWLLQTSVQGNDGGSEWTDCLRKRDLRPSGCPVRTCLLVFFEPALLRGFPDLVLSPRSGSRTKKHSAPGMLGPGQLCSLCLVWEGTLAWSKLYLETLRTQSPLWPREPD